MNASDVLRITASQASAADVTLSVLEIYLMALSKVGINQISLQYLLHGLNELMAIRSVWTAQTIRKLGTGT